MRRPVEFILAVLAWAAATAAAAETAPWIAASNKDANILLEVQAKYVPEGSSARGEERYDAQVLDLKPGVVSRQAADLRSAEVQYEQILQAEADPRVRDDLEILLKAARDQRTSLELNDRLMLPYSTCRRRSTEASSSCWTSARPPHATPPRCCAWKRYVGAEPGYEPITKLARDRTTERLDDPKLTAPWSVELQQELKNQGQYLAGIHDLFKESGLKGWEKDFATLSTQVDAYGKWVRASVLPRARASNLLPPEIYADNLKQYGVTMDPAELMDRALFTFAQTRDEMQTLAAAIARTHGWKSGDYRDVLRELKKERIPNDKLLAVYRARLASIENIIREQKLLTLPQRAAVIQPLATPAESAAIPAPHLSEPRLLGNPGEPAEFVIPTSNPNADSKAEMDDFNYDAITWDLTAHEARPGHELQFAAMVEGGLRQRVRLQRCQHPPRAGVCIRTDRRSPSSRRGGAAGRAAGARPPRGRRRFAGS